MIFDHPLLLSVNTEERSQRLADLFGLVEEVVREACAGVEDFDADEAVVFPVEDDEGLDAVWRVGGDAGSAGHERFVRERDVDRVGFVVVGGPHRLIVPGRSARSWRKTTSDRRRLRQRSASFGVLPSSRLRS